MNKEHMDYIKEHCQNYIGEDDSDYLNTLLYELDRLADLIEYDHTKFSDLIHEEADKMCDIDVDELMKWIEEEPDSDMYMGMALEECMIDISKYTLLRHIQVAQFCKHIRLYHTTLHYIEEGIRSLGFRFEY